MTRQPSSTPATATRAGVRQGSALLLSSIALLAGCAADGRLSLGRHEPSAGTPAPHPGAAGGPAIDPGAPASDRDPPDAAAPIAPEPGAQATPPPVPPTAGAGSAASDADAAVAAQPCTASTYVAELWCAVDPDTLPRGVPGDRRATMPMQAALTFTVEPSPAPERLTVREGTLRFEYMNHAFEGRLAGGLDCASQAFHAEIVDGSFTALFAGGSTTPGRFQGQIDGRFDEAAAPMLAGSWWHGPADVPAGAPAPSCVGTWIARRAP